MPTDDQISEDMWTEIMIDEADRIYWRYSNGARLRATQGMDGHMLTVMVDGVIVGQCCDGVQGRADCRALMDELNASDMKCDAAKHIFTSLEAYTNARLAGMKIYEAHNNDEL